MSFSRFAIIVGYCTSGVIALLIARFLIHTIVRAALRVRMDGAGPLSLRDRVLLRYQPLDFSIWMFAWFKTWLDPMFVELPELLRPLANVRSILDLGCGFGFAGSFLLEWFDEARIDGIEPSRGRVRGAARAFGSRGHVYRGAAPDFEVSELPDEFDAVFVIDVIHFLSDPGLDLTLRRIRARLEKGGYLFIRASMAPDGFGSIIWNLYRISQTLTGTPAHFRSVEKMSQMLAAAGFEVVTSQFSGKNRELSWFISTASVARETGQPAVTRAGKEEQRK